MRSFQATMDKLKQEKLWEKVELVREVDLLMVNLTKCSWGSFCRRDLSVAARGAVVEDSAAPRAEEYRKSWD